ncbi:MAG TPA: outer membrane beta-barrel protein [Bacteroidales bacterium]|nr:outer membrane beta-barrel protein [Bacteroidales bacterium]
MKYFNSAILFIFLINLSVTVFSQQPSHINLSAVVKDTLGETIPAATVMLLTEKDSTLINYTTTDSEGRFSFKNVKNSGYLLKISHISYMPLQKNIPVSNVSEVNLGLIIMEPISEILMEVVIKSAKAPLFIHGDTVEYDARLFKVPPGSTVEDLLRRLPGIDVDANGNISTMGKDVRRIYVDGKTFFSDDPKTVTKNLDAEAISKVQVYDDKSEQERLTGIKEGSQDKVMNLELKDEYKKGHFGKLTVAGGTENRWALRGNFNRFNEKTQLSFIGYGNNMNETGVNWDDYAEFKGNSAQSDYDDGDFGFGSQSRMRFRFMMRYDQYDGRGFTKNAGGGVNYNYFTDKVKFNAGYFYNQSDLSYDQYTNRQTFLPDTSYLRFDTIGFKQFNNAHSLNSRIQIDFDSSNMFIFRANTRLSGNNYTNNQLQQYFTPSLLDINSNTLIDNTDLDAWSLNLLSIYVYDFKKSRRLFAISGAADLNDNSSEQTSENINRFYMATTPEEQIKLLNEDNSATNIYKSSIMYLEPLGKKFSLMGFYNFTYTGDQSGKSAKDILSGNIFVDSLCNYYLHEVNYNRVGASLNFGYEGINLAVGGAFQNINQSGIFSKFKGDVIETMITPRSYNNFIPYFSANVQLVSNIGLNAEYTYNVQEPSLTHLQPIITLSNPLYNIEGNTELTPELSHNFSGTLHYWNQASFTSIYLNAGYNLYETSIVYNQYTEFVENLGYVTHSKPENVSGGNSFNTNLWTNFPIIKTILTMNVSGQVRFSETPLFINSIKNITNSDYYVGRIGLNLTVGPKLNFNFSQSISENLVKYSLQTSQNQNIIQYNTNAGIKWQFAKKSYFESNFGWEIYQNDKFDYEKNLMIVNASIRQILGEKNRFEIRLAAFDLFNQRLYIVQNAAVNYTEYTTSPTLARYFMVSVSYNLKGFETKMKQRGRW